VAIAVALAALGGSSSCIAEPAAASVPPAAAPATINIGGLFGDENEPDENEADEGGSEGESQGSSGAPLPLVLLLVIVGLATARLWLGRLLHPR
jgi:hypothetical protein